MKILHICSYYIGSNLYQNLFNAINEMEIEQDIYVFTDKNYSVNQNTKSNVIISRCYNKFDRLFFHLKHTKVLNDIYSKLKLDKYNIIHAHSLFSNGYIAYSLNKKYNIPYIVAVRNTDVNLFFKRMIHLRNLGNQILMNAEKIIFISEPYKKTTISKFISKKYKKAIENKSIVIPNGISEFWLENKFKNRVIPKHNKIKLLYVGRIDTNKNLETTIKACRILIQQGYQVSFKVVGKIINKKYNDIFKKNSFIDYNPYCQKEDLINHYRDSDIFIMPSKHETFGLVYPEAMSQGLPVIYSSGQGFDGQFAEGEVGYPVKHNSPEEIVQRIKDVLDNYEAISKNCIEKVDKFDWRKIAISYHDIYKNLI